MDKVELSALRVAPFCMLQGTMFINGVPKSVCSEHGTVTIVPYYKYFNKLASGKRILIAYKACPLCIQRVFGDATPAEPETMCEGKCSVCGNVENTERCSKCGEAVCPKHRVTIPGSTTCDECLEAEYERAEGCSYARPY